VRVPGDNDELSWDICDCDGVGPEPNIKIETEREMEMEHEFDDLVLLVLRRQGKGYDAADEQGFELSWDPRDIQDGDAIEAGLDTLVLNRTISDHESG